MTYLTKEEIIEEIKEIIKPLKINYTINVRVGFEKSLFIMMDLSNDISVCVSSMRNYELIVFKNPFKFDSFLKENNITIEDYNLFKENIVNLLKKLECTKCDYFIGSISLFSHAITLEDTFNSILLYFKDIKMQNPIKLYIERLESFYSLSVNFGDGFYLNFGFSPHYGSSLIGDSYRSFLIFHDIKDEDFRILCLKINDFIKVMDRRGIKRCFNGDCFTIDLTKVVYE